MSHLDQRLLEKYTALPLPKQGITYREPYKRQHSGTSWNEVDTVKYLPGKVRILLDHQEAPQ